MNTKTCSACDATQPAAEFYAEKRAPDGLQSGCKTCVKAREQAHRKADPARHARRIANWKAKNPDRWKAIAQKARAKKRAQHD